MSFALFLAQLFYRRSAGSFTNVAHPSPPLHSGKDIWLMGGGELTREFLRDDLVDELHLGVVPVLIGEGIPAFPSGFPERKFTLVENNTYSKGLIALRYERRKGQKK